jgi:hypothetical protein
MHWRRFAIGSWCIGLVVAGARCGGSSSGTGTTPTTTTGSGGTSGSSGASGTTSSSTTGAAGATSGGGGRSGSGGAATGSGGSTGGGGAAGGGGAPPNPVKPPAPPGPGNVPAPSGSAANLKVLPWAGFQGAVTYTFDDSQPSQADHIAELHATGVPVTYYITTVNNRYANYDTIWKDAGARGHELGNHTVNHCYANLTCLAGVTALPTIADELDQCTDYMKTKLAASGPYTMAYPFGDAGYAAEAKKRFFLGRSAGPGTTGGMIAAGDSTDPFALPVIAAMGGEAASKFSGDVDAARMQRKWVIFLFHSILPDAQNWYAGVDISAVTGSIAHAKMLPDVWIDTLANVGAYWLGQKTLQAATPTMAAGSTTWQWTLPDHFPPGRILRVTVDGGTLKQNATTLAWDGHGYYEVSLDASTLTWTR